MWPWTPPLARRRAPSILVPSILAPSILAPSILAALAAPCLVVALGLAGCSGGEAPPEFKALNTGVERPGVDKGDVVAYLVASDGALVIRDAEGQEIAVAPGTPLLASDTLTPAKEALALVLLHNGYTVRVDGGVTLRIDALAVFKDPPATRSIEDQLRASLSDQERGRLGDAGERIGGWQLRRTALDALAPEEMPSIEAAPPPVTPTTPQGAPEPSAEETTKQADAIDGRTPPDDVEEEEDVADVSANVKAGGGSVAGSAVTPKSKKNASIDAPTDRPKESPAKPVARRDQAKVEAPETDPLDDAGDSATTSTKGKSSEPAPVRWTKRSHRWIQGPATGTPSAAIVDALGKCLASRPGAEATAKLTIVDGKITALTIDGAADRSCADALKAIAGPTGSGTLEIKLSR
ncbi:MAG: hypothetical protein R3B09_11705 [Nannocystaceae bacterium]